VTKGAGARNATFDVNGLMGEISAQDSRGCQETFGDVDSRNVDTFAEPRSKRLKPTASSGQYGAESYSIST